MSDRHNMRRGIATLLSVLSVGGAASAAGKKGLSKGQNIRISNSNKVGLKKNGSKKKLSSSKSVDSVRPTLNDNVVSNKPKQLNGNMGVSENFKAGFGGLYDRFRELPAHLQGLLIGSTLESISALTTHKGIVENLSNVIFNRFIDLAREKIFKGPGEDEVNIFYSTQEMTEDIVISKFGPILSVFAKFGYYLNDSWVGPFVAFVKGLKGVKFNDMKKNYKAIKAETGNLGAVSFKQFKGFFDKGVYGKTQLKAWWNSVSNGFKANSLNMFFYELGAKIGGKQITGPLETISSEEGSSI